MSEPSVERGVENPRVVDLIERDADSGEVVLIALERRPWGTDERQLHQLEDKMNSYLGYVLDGYLVQDYPEYEGASVRLQVDCETEPGPAEIGFMNALRNYCSTQQLGFRVVARTSSA